MKNRKKREIAFKFSFSLIFWINAYLHSARNQSVSWKNEISLSWKIEKETGRSPMYQNDNGNTMRVELSLSLSRLFLSTKSTFLKVGAYISLKRATAGVLEGRFCWIWMKMPQFLKYKSGGVGPKTFTV